MNSRSAQRTFQSEPNDSSHGRTSPGLCPIETIDQHIPGAFPTQTTLRKIEEHDRTLSPPSTVEHAFDVFSDYAKQYLPDSVGALIGSKQEGNKLESGIQRTEFPSTEVPSGSRTGVGSLPGKTSEPAVAALPEEKAGRRFNAMTVPDSGPMSRVHRAPFFPSDEVSKGGVGSLPGTPNEIDVVRLPEERFHAAEISSRDSHAPSNFVSSDISQEFPLPQRSWKSTNPFRNGQFASINCSPSRPALEHRHQYDEEDAASIPVHPGKLSGQAAGQAGPSVGSKEPYTFLEELHVPTHDGRGTNPESNSAPMGVRGEDLEITTYNSTSKNMLISPEPAVSESSSARIASKTSASCVAEHDGALSTVSPAHLDFKLAPEISRSSLQEPFTSVTPHLAALAAIGDNPMPVKERVFLVKSEFPPKPNADLSDTTLLQYSKGTLAAGTTFSGTSVGAARPIIPLVNQSVQFQGQTLPRASSTHIQHLTTSSSSDASLSTQDPTSYPRAYDNGKGNLIVIPEKVKENPEAKEEAPKGFLPRLSRWFYRKKSKLPLRREREQETSGTSEEPEESSERREPFSGSEEESAPSLPEDERKHRSHVVDGVEMGSGIDKEATEHQASSDIDRPAIARTPNSTMPQGTIRECLSTAFVGSGTLRHQSLHQPPATTIRAPIDTGDNLGLDRHHLGSYSPVIPRHVPAHFDETIGPLPNHFEKRSGKELPSQEKPGGSRVGIGSLPGDEDEEGVALGPDEKCGSIAETTSVSHSPAHGGLESTLSSPEPSVSSIDSLPLNAQTIGPNASSFLGTDPSNEALVSSSTVPKRQSVLSGAEHDTIDSSTQEGDRPSHLESFGVNTRELGDQDTQGGFLVGLVHGVEEMTESIGQIARRHVPESVGDYLPHYAQLGEFSKTEPPHQGSSLSKISRPGKWSPSFTTPSESACGSPLEALGAQIHAKQSETRQEIDDLRTHQGPLLDPTGQSSGPSARLKKRVLKDPLTPLEISSHPSQSSAGDFRPPRAPFSTHEQISGNPADVTPAVKEQYMRSIVDEPEGMLVTGGSLSGYPGPVALSALIGERIYDEHMRAAGAQEPIQTTRNHTPRKSFPKPVAPRAGNFLPECIAVETEDVLSQESPTSQRHPAAKNHTCHAWALLSPQDHGMAQSAAVTSQYHTASPVDISGEISTPGLARQSTTPLNRLETPTQVQCAVGVPRPLQPSAIPSVVERPSGRGFGVDDLGKPIISGETGLKSFLDEHARGRTCSHNGHTNQNLL